MKFQFTQFEIESRVSAAFEHGDEIKIADRIGRSQTYISQMYNKDDERESNIYKALRDIAALLDISQERGQKVIRIFNEIIERHIELPTYRDTRTEIHKLNKEIAEANDAVMLGAPLEKQIQEISDVENQAKNVRKAKETDLAQTRRIYDDSNAHYFGHKF